MGLGLLCRSLSKSPNPWLGIIPETRNISACKRTFYMRLWSEIITYQNKTGEIHPKTKQKPQKKERNCNNDKIWKRMHCEVKLDISRKNWREFDAKKILSPATNQECLDNITSSMFISVTDHLYLIQANNGKLIYTKLHHALRCKYEAYRLSRITPSCQLLALYLVQAEKPNVAVKSFFFHKFQIVLNVETHSAIDAIGQTKYRYQGHHRTRSKMITRTEKTSISMWSSPDHKHNPEMKTNTDA